LLHEIGHIVLHLSTKDDIFIDLVDKETSQIEQEADKFAEKYLSDGVHVSIKA
jgi:Zn-dependent peptidase ImmA (M78 family)